MPKGVVFLLRIRTYEDEPDVAHVHLVRRDGGANEGTLYGAMNPASAKKLAKQLSGLGIESEWDFVEEPKKVVEVAG